MNSQMTQYSNNFISTINTIIFRSTFQEHQSKCRAIVEKKLFEYTGTFNFQLLFFCFVLFKRRMVSSVFDMQYATYTSRHAHSYCHSETYIRTVVVRYRLTSWEDSLIRLAVDIQTDTHSLGVIRKIRGKIEKRRELVTAYMDNGMHLI